MAAAYTAEAAIGLAALGFALLYQKVPFFVRRRYEIGAREPRTVTASAVLHGIVAGLALLYTIAIRSGMHVVYAAAKARLRGML